jgi:hypothetical protein
MAITKVNIFRFSWGKCRKGQLDLFMENQKGVKLKREIT